MILVQGKLNHFFGAVRYKSGGSSGSSVVITPQNADGGFYTRSGTDPVTSTDLLSSFYPVGSTIIMGELDNSAPTNVASTTLVTDTATIQDLVDNNNGGVTSMSLDNGVLNFTSLNGGSYDLITQNTSTGDVVHADKLFTRKAAVRMVNTSVNNYATFSTPGGGTGGNGGMPDFGAHIYWRVRMDYTAVNVNNGAFNVGELQFRSATGVPQQAIGGTAIASSFYVGNGQQFPPQEAFDNSQTAGNGWEEMDKLSDGSGPGDLWYNPRFNPDSPNGFVSGESWLGYHYPTPISVVQVMLGNQQYYENGLPMHFDVQYSDDGSTWTTAWTVNDAFTDSVSQYDLAGYVFTADGTTGPTEPPLQ